MAKVEPGWTARGIEAVREIIHRLRDTRYAHAAKGWDGRGCVPSEFVDWSAGHRCIAGGERGEVEDGQGEENGPAALRTLAIAKFEFPPAPLEQALQNLVSRSFYESVEASWVSAPEKDLGSRVGPLLTAACRREGTDAEERLEALEQALGQLDTGRPPRKPIPPDWYEVDREAVLRKYPSWRTSARTASRRFSDGGLRSTGKRWFAPPDHDRNQWLPKADGATDGAKKSRARG